MTEGIAIADLLKFCTTSWRETLKSPFSRAGYTWATDGHIMLRVALRDDVPENDDAPRVEKVWTDYNGEFVPVTPFKLPSPSEFECDACRGRGTKHDCPNCQCMCRQCAGSGKDGSNIFISVGPSAVSWRSAALMMTLPALEVEVPAVATQDRLHFQFAGGEGIVMLAELPHEVKIVADLLAGAVL